MLLVSLTYTAPAWAQRPVALERNLPPPVQTPRNDLTPQRILPSEDTTPLGVDVQGVRLFGLEGEALTSPARGITVDNVEGVPAADLEAAVRPFLNQPLSQQLIAQIRVAVVEAYRSAGKPFVSVTTPPQEVTSGVLQLQVVPYRLGEVKSSDPVINGVVPHAAGLRAQRGELINASQLSEDIDWLNRFPYRQINGVFEPGTTPGSTDLTLTITRQKPWRIYGGYSNTGSEATGHDRYFAGFAAGIEALNDMTLSYQITGSDDFWKMPSRGRLSGQSWPGYISHAGRIAIPTFYRQGIEIAPNFVATRQETFDRVLSFRNTTFELPILYRTALSNLWVDAPAQTELYVGPSLKWAERHTAYDVINLARGNSSTFSIILGGSGYWQGADKATNMLDLRVVANPGGVLPGNTDRVWQIQTNGRVNSAQYVYGLAQYERSMPLSSIPGLSGFSANTSFTGLLSGQALPDTEQLSLGGAAAVRGYSSNDAAVDTGLVLRNELRLPAFSLLNLFKPKPVEGEAAVPAALDSFSPYVFLDYAYGHNFANSDFAAAIIGPEDVVLLGTGAGFDMRVASNMTASMSAGWALKNGVITKRGDFTLNARVSMSY